MATDYRKIRIEKLEKLRDAGINGYAYSYPQTHSVEQIERDFDALSEREEVVSIAGRVMANRRQGRAGFAHVEDRTGRFQLYLREDVLGVDTYAVYRGLDIGDHVGVAGTLFITKTGERTLSVQSFELLAKSLLPLPEKWHGLRDIEARSRMRYADLVMNREVREIFLMRSNLISFIRRFLDGRGFQEVETPVLQPVYGGAFAKPFKAYYEALDNDYYLRISDELYLKRLIVGGLERVYEIGKDFRNEGMDRSHNPEFTQMEVYQAYTDYMGMLELCESMVSSAFMDVLGSHELEFEGESLNFKPPWRRIRFMEALSERLGHDALELSRDELAAVAKERGIKTDPGASAGRIIDDLFKELVEPNLVQPTFVLDYPREISPLAKVHRDDPRLVERFEPFAGRMELGNAFSEQNDPLEQRRQLERQAELRAKGDVEAHVLDNDYLRALEFGMPPTGGLGVGIDRLCMLLCGQRNIRDVILFPHLRPEGD